MSSNKQTMQTPYFFICGDTKQNTVVTNGFTTTNTNVTMATRKTNSESCVGVAKKPEKKTNKPWYRKEARKRW